MGVVYRAHDPLIQRPVALKMLYPSAAANTEVRDRFRQEAKAIGLLVHPSIVTLYQFGEEAGALYIAMEFVSGASLAALAKSGLLQVDRILELLRQIAEGLDFAHQQGVVHRDIKPANILVTDEGRAKITDFGIARIAFDPMTQTGMTMGTLSYMAPEQIRSSRVDGKADQFSLAVVAYELLTGVQPFRSPSEADLMVQIASEPAPPAHSIHPRASPAQSEVLGRALAKDPQNRYPTCQAFVGALAGLQSGRPSGPPTTATLPSPAPLRTMRLAAPNDGNLIPGFTNPADLVHKNSGNPLGLAARAVSPISGLGAIAALAGLVWWGSGFVSTGTASPNQTYREAANLIAKKRYAEALPLLESAAGQGHAQSMFQLGLTYEQGLANGKPDALKAVAWYRKAADAGIGEAQNNLGRMYFQGIGVAKDLPLAETLFLQAGDKNVRPAYNNLCLIYRVEDKLAEALPWCRKAHQAGSADSTNALGFLYSKGIPGTLKKDDKQAADFYRSAAEHGNSDAMVNLGAAYSVGSGVPKLPAEAVHWWQRAAAAGDPRGMFLLGIAYESGIGIRKSIQDAAQWYKAASERGVDAAAGRLKKLGR